MLHCKHGFLPGGLLSKQSPFQLRHRTGI